MLPRSIRRLGICGVLLVLAAGSVHAQSFADVGRVPVYAAVGAGAVVQPYTMVQIGAEARYALAPTGRTQLALRPAQVAAGGRVFVYAKVPPRLGQVALDAEFLIREQAGWRRRHVLSKQAGELGHVTATLVVPDLESGAVPTAVFVREAVARKSQVISSSRTRVPVRSKLKLSYGLDEWDWTGLAPVTVSLVATMLHEGSPTGREVELFKKRIEPAGERPHWYDETIDLEALGGSTVRFVFRALPDRVDGKLAPHVVWGAPTIVFAGQGRRPPSIVLVSLDGVRARSLSCCGSGRATSPFIDKLFAEQGVIFDHAVTQAVATIPAHMSLLTGLFPSVHGVLSTDNTLGRGVETMVMTLAESGYATAAFTDGPGLSAGLGFGEGFTLYHQDPGSGPWDVEGRAGPTFQAAMAWAEQRRDEPFFLFVHTSQARQPYVPPQDYLDLFKDAQLDNPDGIDQGALVRYEREIRYLDDTLQQFVTGLDRIAHPERTLLVVTSGHGQEFLEHGARSSGTQLYEESIRVPLMMRGAGIRPARRYGEVIGLVDVAPTVLELAGLGAPRGMQGQSIAKSLRSGLPYTLPPRFTEAHGARRLTASGTAEAWRPPAYAISSSGHKIIMQKAATEQPAYEAFDLVADPEERNSLAELGAERPPWVAELKQVLDNYPTACKQVARPTGDAPVLPVETRVNLKAFGYTN